jgi:endonuclease/exonuclease/phosphatase family metal-dependent hydrolase
LRERRDRRRRPCPSGRRAGWKSGTNAFKNVDVWPESPRSRPDPVGEPDERSSAQRLRLVTYNIHSGFGRDGRLDLERIGTVLRTEEPDVVALQEVDRGLARTGLQDQAAALAARLGLASRFCTTRTMDRGDFGLAVLSRFPVVAAHEYDLTYHERREPRSCLRVDLEVEPGTLLHVFNCHLGLATLERRYQRRRMLSDAILLSEELHDPVVLMGDFNDRPFSVVHSGLRQHFVDAFNTKRRRGSATFRFGPLALRLDHIYVSRQVRVVDCTVCRNPAARVASDHRPLMAEIEIDLAGGAVVSEESP